MSIAWNYRIYGNLIKIVKNCKNKNSENIIYFDILDKRIY